MKSLTIFLALTFSVMSSSSSYAGWTKVFENPAGDLYLDLDLDTDKIKVRGDTVYYWFLFDYLKPPRPTNMWSTKFYIQGDCKLFRFKRLRFITYEEPMGGGTGRADNYPDKDWTDPAPNSGDETALKLVCDWKE
jgi:hypothetical protein